MKGYSRSIRGPAVVGFVTLILALTAFPLAALGGPPADAEYIGSETCADCHDDVAESFGGTAHGLLLGKVEKYEGKLCESCHGPGSVHAEEGDAELIWTGETMFSSNRKSPCLDCHTGRQFYDWQFSSHMTEDVNCASCHASHVPAGQVLKQSTPELCYDCHSDVRASFYMPSHHPVVEGKLDCQSCHGIHGSGNKFAVGQDVREQCFSCHADKEGPFIFEHDPSNEDCSICHLPHGSVADNLLVQSEPTLCLNCHSMHFHATIPGIDNDGFEAPQAPGRQLSSTYDSFKRSFLTKCTQCHTAIHGTDQPAQGISSGGTGFTR